MTFFMIYGIEKETINKYKIHRTNKISRLFIPQSF